MKTNRKHRFTLIELLVTVAIIAILAGILLPALNKARQSARKAVCTGNLKTMGQGIALYSSGNDDYLTPHMKRWGWTYFVGDLLKKLPQGFPAGEWETALGGFTPSLVPTDKSFYCPLAFSVADQTVTAGAGSKAVSKAATSYTPILENSGRTSRDSYGWGYLVNGELGNLALPKKVSSLKGNPIVMTELGFEQKHGDNNIYSLSSNAFITNMMTWTAITSNRLTLGMNHGGALNHLRLDMGVSGVSVHRAWDDTIYQFK